MDWIKKHYDQFALGLISIVVLACAILLYLKTQSFPEQFSSAVEQPPKGRTLPPIVLNKIDDANALLKNPPQWTPSVPGAKDNKRGMLFVSEQYVLGKTGTPERIQVGSYYKVSLTGEDIPNTWFTDKGISVFDPTAPFQDPDKDGFPNEIEYLYKTDPQDANSHPPYYKMLFLKAVEQTPFRLRFDGYDGDPRKGKAEDFSYQINTIDLRQPSEFLKLGEKVAHTNFQLIKFEYKTAKNLKTDEQEEVSELTLKNTETGDVVVLILGKVVNSPNYFVRFNYEWPSPAQPPLRPVEFTVKKLGTFALRPNVKEIYKLIDIKDNVAVIQLPDGQKTPEGATTVQIARDPRGK